MDPQFLVPETVVRQGGTGEQVALDEANRLLQVTLGITQIVEQESLQVTICGSADGTDWDELVSFPPKSYCGVYTEPLDLTTSPQVRMLQARWQVERWGGEEDLPRFSLFGFHVFVGEAAAASEAGAG